MEITSVIAQNLQRLRTERGLSLGQLAQLTQVSKVMLSQIEKGETNPTINTLWKIANGLKVPYTALLDQREQETQVIGKENSAIQVTQEGHYRIYCYYRTTPRRNFELFQIELDEGCRYTSLGHSEKSEEYIMVLEGGLTVEVDGHAYTLAANDCIRFAASSKHVYINSGEGILKAAVTNFYPV